MWRPMGYQQTMSVVTSNNVFGMSQKKHSGNIYFPDISISYYHKNNINRRMVNKDVHIAAKRMINSWEAGRNFLPYGELVAWICHLPSYEAKPANWGNYSQAVYLTLN